MAEKLLAQPFFRYLGADVEDRLDALEVTAEREVEAVEMLFVLDQAGARQRIEIIERKRHDARVERLEQREKFARRDGQLARLEMKEEVDQHGFLPVDSARCRNLSQNATSSPSTPF